MKANKCRTIFVMSYLFAIALVYGPKVLATSQQSKCHGAFLEGTTRAEARFLSDTNPTLLSQRKLVQVAARSAGKNEADPLKAIQKYIDYLNRVYPRVRKNEQKRAQITTTLVKPYIIRELPETYIALQKQIARERG